MPNTSGTGWNEKAVHGVAHRPWRVRCVEQAELEERQRRSRRLMEVAELHLEMAPLLLGDPPHVAYLTDSDGIVLRVVIPPGSSDETLQPGFDARDFPRTECAPTGTAAVRAVSVLGEESGAAAPVPCRLFGAAPVHAPTGEVVGAIGLHAPGAPRGRAPLLLATYVARAIERDLAFPPCATLWGPEPDGGGILSGAALAVVLHELRQPVSSLSNVAALLTEDCGAGDPLVGILSREVDRIRRLTDDLGDVSRLAMHGVLRLRPEKLDLVALARDVAGEREPGFRGRDQELELRVPQAPFWIVGDPLRLRQVLGNLLENACKYTPSRGRILLAVRREDSRAVVEVRDSGCGLEPGDMEHVFELFGQGARSREGLGIGLFLVRRLVELHGGWVDACSDGPGKGSAFVVRLPMSGPVRGVATTG